MPDVSTKPTWIEPPPPRPSGMGCFGKGCLALIIAVLLAILVFSIGGYFFFSHSVVSRKPRPLPIKALPPQELAEVQERLQQFAAAPPSPMSNAPAPVETPANGAPPAPTPPEKQLVLTSGEINGLIANNRRARGHASVSIAGNTATVQLSIPSDKIPGFPRGYLNGSFVITTNGPTPLSALRVSKIEANGYPMPSAVLSVSYRGRSVLSYAMEEAAPYNVSTAEIRDGEVILH